MMQNNQNERYRLMQKITKVGFALDDITLYLDTHPSDADAMDYYRHMNELYLKLQKEYEDHFGPLTQNGGSNSRCWQWATEKWPWERGFF